MRRFAGVSLDDILDETTICKFRHFLRTHGLTEVLFERTVQHLSERGLLMRIGTIVDATIVAAPASTKNRDRAQDPEMGSAQKPRRGRRGISASKRILAGIHMGGCITWRVHRKATRGRKRTCADRTFNRKNNRVRARVEHVFGIIKHRWGYRTVRYRGVANNAAQLATLFARANLYFVWRQLQAA